MKNRFLKTLEGGFVDLGLAICISPYAVHLKEPKQFTAIFDGEQHIVCNLPDGQTFEDVAKDWMALREAVAPAYLVQEVVSDTPIITDPDIAKLLLQNRQHRVDELIVQARKLTMAVPSVFGKDLKTVEDCDRIIKDLEGRIEARIERDKDSL